MSEPETRAGGSIRRSTELGWTWCAALAALAATLAGCGLSESAKTDSDSSASTPAGIGEKRTKLSSASESQVAPRPGQPRSRAYQGPRNRGNTMDGRARRLRAIVCPSQGRKRCPVLHEVDRRALTGGRPERRARCPATTTRAACAAAVRAAEQAHRSFPPGDAR